MKNSKIFLTGAIATALVLPSTVLGLDQTVTVKPGDTLSEIAAKSGITVNKIKSLNNLTSDKIRVGQVLQIGGASTVSSSTGNIANATYVNIRSGPGMSYKSLTALKKGTQVKIISEKGGWSQVVAGNVKGYVASNYISKSAGGATNTAVAAKTGVVSNTTYLNVRSGPGMSNKTITTLKGGTQVTIHSVKNGWYNISVGKVNGYVASNYIKTGAAATAAPAKPVQAQKAVNTSAKPLNRPTETTRITSVFGPRWGSFHYGVDYALAGNQKIMAAADGVVTRSFYHKSLGEVVFIKHTVNGKVYETVYGHMRSGSRAVGVGAKVTKGQFIGWMGSTGNSTGQHLHFEVHPGGYLGNKSAVDPTKYVN